MISPAAAIFCANFISFSDFRPGKFATLDWAHELTTILYRLVGSKSRIEYASSRNIWLVGSNGGNITNMLVKIEVYNDGESWCARGIGEDIFTQGPTVDELYKNIREAVALHFEDSVPASEINILIVSELKLTHAPVATS